MIGVGKSDIGRCRAKNEDSMMVSNTAVGNLPNVYVIADGMGGHKAGNVASSVAIKCFNEYVQKPEHSNDEVLDILIGGINYANSVVYNMTLENEEYSNMGTTFLACTICGNNAYIAHVGDCRLYKISNYNITQITNDHSYVAELVRMGRITEEEAAVHPDRHSITRAVGSEPTVIADGIICSISSGDIILMCSDGLTNMIDNDAILHIADDGILTLDQKVDKLIDTANENGGIDNITAILIGKGEVE